MEDRDKKNCFARVSEDECSALVKKNCAYCPFYKHKNTMPWYKDFIKKIDRK